MATNIFVNLSVKDLNASVAFFTRLGFSFNPQMTDEKGTCMVISDTFNVMLLVEPFFQTFTAKPLVDAHQANEVIIGLSVDSRAEVDRLADAALAAGGQSVPQQPENEMEFMYDRNFQDLDGHLWNVLYMDPTFAQQPASRRAVTATSVRYPRAHLMPVARHPLPGFSLPAPQPQRLPGIVACLIQLKVSALNALCLPKTQTPFRPYGWKGV